MTGFNTIVTCRPDVTGCSMVPNVVSGNFCLCTGLDRCLAILTKPHCASGAGRSSALKLPPKDHLIKDNNFSFEN